MLKSYKYRIYPNKQQRQIIDQTISLCQQLYNSALEHRIVLYKGKKISINYHDQAKELKEIKQALPEYQTIYSQVLQDALKRLDKAYQNFFRRVKLGQTPGFPRFQSYKRYNSFTYPQSGFNLSGSRLQLSKIGDIKIKFHRPILGKIKTCTIICKNDKYYVCFSCEVNAEIIPLTHQDVGIDVGIKEFLATSDGKLIPNPKNYRMAEAKFKKQQRAVSRKKKGSNRRKKAVNILAKTHEHIANQRIDNAFKVANYLFREYDVVYYEDLHINNMVKNHKLAKSISDAGWGLFFSILDATAKQVPGKKAIKVDPRYTSQMCSNCGQIVKKNLSVRIHSCDCGLIIDRDVNAAKNILQRGQAA